MEDPIATYQEAQYGLRRRFELFPDHIRLTGQGHSLGRFDETVMLATLRPEPSRMWSRGKLFRYGLITLACAVGVVVGFVLRDGFEALTDPSTVWVAGPLAGVGLGLVLANV